MKKLSQLLESINEVNSLLEIDFKSKEAFKKYQAKHKMKPSTKVNIAGKDTTVGDEMGDDSETPQAPKKTTGADIEKQADKSGKEKSDIEKDIMGDEPKSDEPKSVRKDTISRRHEDTKETLNDLRDEYQEAKEAGDTEEMEKISKMRNLYINHSEAQRLALGVIETQGDFNIDKIKEVVAGGPEKISSEDLNAAVSEVGDLIDEIKSDDDYDMDEVRQLSKLRKRLRRVGNNLQDIKKDEPKSDDSKEKSSDIYHPDNIGEFDEKNHKFNIMKVNKLNNPERFRKQPVETLENLEGMLYGIRNELDSNYDFAKGFDDNDYAIVEDDLLMRVAQAQDELGDNPSESEIEDFYEDMRELGNDIESFMKGNYAKATKVNTGRRVGSGMYDNVNPKSSTPLRELSKITTRYNK